MDTTHFISIQKVCAHYNLPMTFIEALREYDLVEVTVSENEYFIQINQLNTIEKMMRLHYDLDINFEGIDAIYNLLKQNEVLQNEITRLHNRLKFYEAY